MKKRAATKATPKIDWDVVCEQTRQRCNKLSEEEMRRYQDEALRIIYGAHGKAPARSR